MVWLWPQWQSGLLRKNAHDALEADQDAIRLILSDDHQAPALAYQRMRVNQAHNALFNSLNQAMQEPGFNSHYLEDMKLWVTHSQFIVEHINAMTTLARDHARSGATLSGVLRDCAPALPAAAGFRWAGQRRGCEYHGGAGCGGSSRPAQYNGAASAAHPRASEHHAHDFIGGMASASASWHLAACH